MTEGAELPAEGETGATAPTDAASATEAPADGAVEVVPQAEGAPPEGAPADGAPAEAAPAEAAPLETAVEAAPLEAAPLETAAEAAPVETAVEAAPGVDGVSAPTDEVLARSDQEAAEAIRTGTFEGTYDTVKISRDEIASAPTGSLGAPVVGGAAEPAPESPLAAVKRAAALDTSSAEPVVSTAESLWPSSAAPAPAPVNETAPTEKFDRGAVAVHVDGARPEPEAPRAAAPVEGKRDAARSSATLKARSEEDDRLLAALIFLDPPTQGPERPPSPFATIAGVSLLKRAAASVRSAGAPRVLLAGNFDQETLEKAKSEFAKAGFSGPLDTWNAQTPLPLGDRGRVLILDAAGVHDPEAVARLARWRGERACVLLAEEGDGLRVQVEGGKVKEVGSSLVPFDGVTCGAVNVPLPLFPRLTELGALGALLALAREDLLAATIERRTFAREITSETGLAEARQRLLDRASGGSSDSILNRLVHRRLSRPLTGVLLPLGVPPMLLTVGSGLVGFLGAAMLSGCGQAPQVWIMGLGVFLLFASIVLDCAADELAALGMTDSRLRRTLALVLDGLVSVTAVLGLGLGAQLLKVADGVTLGAYAAIGVGIASLLTIITSRGDAPPATDTVSRGVELLEARIKGRDVTYLMLVIVVAHAIYQALQPPLAADAVDVAPKVLWLSLVILPALAHAFWVALAVLVVAKPRQS